MCVLPPRGAGRSGSPIFCHSSCCLRHAGSSRISSVHGTVTCQYPDVNVSNHRPECSRVMPDQPTNPLPVDGSSARRCPNCDAEADGAYCGLCGQDNRSPRLSFRSIAAATFEHIVDLDVPVLRTIGHLTWRPGWVASEYVRGRRKPESLFHCWPTWDTGRS